MMYKFMKQYAEPVMVSSLGLMLIITTDHWLPQTIGGISIVAAGTWTILESMSRKDK